MKILTTLAVLATTCQTLLAFAQPGTMPPASVVSGAHAATENWTLGEIKKIDAPATRVTLQHGDIKSLGMPAMTMVFRVRHPDMLNGFKLGDKVRFHVVLEGGVMTITQWIRAQT